MSQALRSKLHRLLVSLSKSLRLVGLLTASRGLTMDENSTCQMQLIEELFASFLFLRFQIRRHTVTVTKQMLIQKHYIDN